MSDLYGVLRTEGYSERALFVIDKLGIIRYIDIHDIDEQPSNIELFRVLHEVDPDGGKAVEVKTTAEPNSSRIQADITLYCTSWCPDCRRARHWLKAKNLDFVYIDIDADPAASEQVKKWNDGKRITPTFDIGGQILPNFNEQELMKALEGWLKP